MPNWLARVAKGLGEVSPVFIDGLLYVLLAICTAIVASLNSDEAAKYIVANWLFLLRSFFSWTGAGLLALKMYRSTQFADHVAEKKAASGNTVFMTNTETTNKP